MSYFLRNHLCLCTDSCLCIRCFILKAISTMDSDPHERDTEGLSLSFFNIHRKWDPPPPPLLSLCRNVNLFPFLRFFSWENMSHEDERGAKKWMTLPCSSRRIFPRVEYLQKKIPCSPFWTSWRRGGGKKAGRALLFYSTVLPKYTRACIRWRAYARTPVNQSSRIFFRKGVLHAHEKPGITRHRIRTFFPCRKFAFLPSSLFSQTPSILPRRKHFRKISPSPPLSNMK